MGGWVRERRPVNYGYDVGRIASSADGLVVVAVRHVGLRKVLEKDWAAGALKAQNCQTLLVA